MTWNRPVVDYSRYVYCFLFGRRAAREETASLKDEMEKCSSSISRRRNEIISDKLLFILYYDYTRLFVIHVKIEMYEFVIRKIYT